MALGCGRVGAIPVLLMYYVLSNSFLLNMIIASILQGYMEETKAESLKLGGDNLIKFQELWAEYDPDGSGLIKADRMLDFFTHLKEPMGINQSLMNNELYAIMITVSLTIPVLNLNKIKYFN